MRDLSTANFVDSVSDEVKGSVPPTDSLQSNPTLPRHLQSMGGVLFVIVIFLG